MPRAVVVGAGPAGIAASGILSRANVEVALVDEGRRPGGQIYRAPAHGLALDMRRVLGDGFSAYEAFHAQAAAVVARVNYRPDALVWGVHDGAAHIASSASAGALKYDVLVLATGATDRAAPTPGWTLPGVFALGGAQALLKDQGCLIGRRIAFVGSSPLLYLAALQALRVGGEVAAVIDTSRFVEKVRALPDMLAAPSILFDGLRYMYALRRRGVQIFHGALATAFEGDRHVAAVRFHVGAKAERIACDAVAYGHGLRPETQLAELAGCSFRFDPIHRTHIADADIDGRAGRGVYIAGDGGAIGGAQAAAISGRLAAAAALKDLGLAAPSLEFDRERAELRRLRRFQRGLATAFRWPREMFASLDDNVTLCRCEAISVGEARSALREAAISPEPNRLKAATRCGMGRCQGRFCGAALAELAAVEARDEIPGRLRAQAPIKPLPIAIAENAAS